jgi:hypothetical protein
MSEDASNITLCSSGIVNEAYDVYVAVLLPVVMMLFVFAPFLKFRGRNESAMLKVVVTYVTNSWRQTVAYFEAFLSRHN